ncbi:MAG TPA: hypothetical protein GXZ36_10620 [Firmicutes bacterium]|jgi:hypothetical protein|nr:hypothetical protein [Bacillota bacterium]
MIGKLGSILPNYYRPTFDEGARIGRFQQVVAGSEVRTPEAREENFPDSHHHQMKPTDKTDPGRRQLPEWTEVLTDRVLKKLGLLDCETCESRKYQDESNDPGVSYKSAARISPEEAAVKVRAHEQEHVVRNQDKAEREGKEVLFQTVRLYTAVCPECGRIYVSGGETRTVTKGKAQEEFRPGSNFDAKL